MAAHTFVFITIFSLSTTVALGVFVGAHVPLIGRYKRQIQAIYGSSNYPNARGQPLLPYQPVSHISYGPDSARANYPAQSVFSQQQFEPFPHQVQGNSRFGGVQEPIRPIQSTIETREQSLGFPPGESPQIYPLTSSEAAFQPGFSQSHIAQPGPPLSIVNGVWESTGLQPGFTHKVKVTRVADALPPQQINGQEPGFLGGTVEPNFRLRGSLGCCINGEGPCCGQEEIYQPNRFQSPLINNSEFQQPSNRGFTGSGAAFTGNIAENYPNDQNSAVLGYRQSTFGPPPSIENYPVSPPTVFDRQAIQVGVGTPGLWTEWSSWSSCSLQVQYRTRSCDYGKNALANGCLGKAYESIPCVGSGNVNGNDFANTESLLAAGQNPATTNDESLIGRQVSPTAFYSQAADTVLSNIQIQPTIRTYGGSAAVIPLVDSRKAVKKTFAKFL
uniref:Uncharacterized protein n=1 Tax=Plectus sambesii TaxID=2011161 RepID=A0A914ULS5_9BILA